MAIAKLFMIGRSQAVMLPKEFRFEDDDEVMIKRMGDCGLPRVAKLSVRATGAGSDPDTEAGFTLDFLAYSDLHAKKGG